MITEKVLGAYASVGSLPPAEQAEWYRKAAREWEINTFEIPILAGVPLAPELVETFAELHASLVVTLVAQWATVGQQNPAYGLSSSEESSRQGAMLDARTILQQCVALSQQGVRIRNVVVHTGQRTGETIPQAIAFYRSLVNLCRSVAAVLPDSTLAVEVTDSLPADHPLPFPSAKKASLPLSSLIQVLATVNRETLPGPSIPLIVNWGRLLINGDSPLSSINQILESEVPLGGAILSGAGATEHGFADSHNSHLDPDSGFTAEDGFACAAVLKSSTQPIFFGMKCSPAKGSEQVSVEAVLTAQAELLSQVG